MFIGKMAEQTGGINIQAINRSAAQKAEKKPEETQALNGQTDTLTLSPSGKKQSLIEQLMKQKEFLQERKQSLMEDASENGSQSMEQLKEYDRQLESIDEQIVKLQSEEMTDAQKSEEDKEGRIYEKPKTKEEAQGEQTAELTAMASNLETAEVISSVKNQVDGRGRVLKAEIRSGNGNLEKKAEEAASLEDRSEQLTANMAGEVQETNEAMADTKPAKDENRPLTEAVTDENASTSNPLKPGI